MDTNNYPFYWDPYMNPSMYEKLTNKELQEITRQALILIAAIIAAVISTDIVAGLLHLLKVI